MFICSLFSVSLFIFTRMPVAGIVSGILYVVFCISVSLFLATIGADAMENRTVKGASSLFLVVFALLLINLNYSFLIDGDGLYTWIGASRVLLWNKSTGGGLLSEIRPFAPSSWVMSGMTGYTWLFILALFALCIPLLIAASRLIYIRSMEKTFGKKRRVASVQRRFKPHPFLSRQNGTIFQKHLYQIICEPLYIFCFAASVIGGIMLFQKNPVLEGTIVSIVLILIVIEGRLFFNIFGYETFSLDRYRLAPVSGLDILKAKNAALFVAMSCQYAPFFIMSFVTLSVALAVNLLFISGIVWLVYTMWGNVSSLLLVTPAVMMDETSPPANDKFINVCVSIAPLLVINYVKDLLAPLPVIISVTAAFISLIVCTVVYKILIARQGRYLESKMEEVVLELSKQ
jgi:hypothetical protein